MIWTVFIAVCLTTTAPRNCNQQTAVDWVAAPEQQIGLGECLIHGEEYAANSRLVRDGEYVKVFCSSSSIGQGSVG